MSAVTATDQCCAARPSHSKNTEIQGALIRKEEVKMTPIHRQRAYLHRKP